MKMSAEVRKPHMRKWSKVMLGEELTRKLGRRGRTNACEIASCAYSLECKSDPVSEKRGAEAENAGMLVNGW